MVICLSLSEVGLRQKYMITVIGMILVTRYAGMFEGAIGYPPGSARPAQFPDESL
jgi:hypothetical protein